MPLLGNRGLFGGLFDGFRPHPGGDPKIRAMGGGFGGLFAPFRGVFGGMFPGAGVPGFPNTGGYPGGYPAMGGFRGDGFSPGGFGRGFGPGPMGGFGGYGGGYGGAPIGAMVSPGGDWAGAVSNDYQPLQPGELRDNAIMRSALNAGPAGSAFYAQAAQLGVPAAAAEMGMPAPGRFGPTGVDYGAYGAARGFGNAPYVPPGTSYTGVTGNQAPYGSNYTPASSFVDNNASTPTNYSPSGGGGNMGAVQQARRR